MKILLIGLNHKSAPIEIRERLSFSAEETAAALSRLREAFPRGEFVLLSTCNRVEIYSASDREGWETGEELAQYLAENREVDLGQFKDSLYICAGARAVSHLFRVTSSLDSLVVGESQIVSQVKDSYKLACDRQATGKVLNRLFHAAFATSKEIHATTGIAKGRVSVAGVAIELAQQLFGKMTKARALVIGAGEMGELLVQHLLHVRCKETVIVNRTLARAEEMAQQYRVSARPWEELDDAFVNADIVIGSATCDTFLYDQAALKSILRRRRRPLLLIIDIAVPRNFDPTIHDLEGVYLFSVDDLAGTAQQNQKSREQDVAVGLEIVRESTHDFMEWFGIRDLGPLIGQLKEAFMQVTDRELDRFFAGSQAEASSRDAMEPMVKRIVNKLLYCLIKNVNVVAKEQGPSEALKTVGRIVSHAEELSNGSDAEAEMPGGTPPK